MFHIIKEIITSEREFTATTYGRPKRALRKKQF